jgi:hypothetical protein
LYLAHRRVHIGSLSPVFYPCEIQSQATDRWLNPSHRKRRINWGGLPITNQILKSKVVVF